MKTFDISNIDLEKKIEELSSDIDQGSLESKINLGNIITPSGKICQVHLLITNEEDDFFENQV